MCLRLEAQGITSLLLYMCPSDPSAWLRLVHLEGCLHDPHSHHLDLLLPSQLLADWHIGKTDELYEAILRELRCIAGKVGAIVAGVVLGQISDQNKFIVSAITGLVGFIITFIFVPGAPLNMSCQVWP